jgi:hypothetical protein
MGKRLAITIAAGAAGLLALAATASADPINVTNTDDSGTGSLRAAIDQANQLPGFDRIVIDATGAIRPQAALPDLTTNLAIKGPGRDALSVHGCTSGASDCIHRVCFGVFEPLCFDVRLPTFAIATGADVTLRDISVAGPDGCTGPVFCLENVDNSGTLSLEHTRVYRMGNLLGGGSVQNNGGTLTVSRSLVRGTSGIDNSGGSLTVEQSTFEANGGCNGSQGGVLYNGGGTMVVSRSTLSGNGCNAIANAGGTTTVRLTTVSNSANSGIANRAGTVAVLQSTVVDNSVGIAGGASTTFKSTILDNNQVDCGGVVTSRGYNISNGNEGSNPQESDCQLTATGDQQFTDPMLGKSLDDNGGPTQTFRLQKTSPAVDAGFAGTTTSTDQRGLPRKVDYPGVPHTVGGNNADVGAFELQAP